MALGAGYDIIIIPGQSNSWDRGMGSFTSLSTAKDSSIFQVGRWGADNNTIVSFLPRLEFWQDAGYHGYGYSLARLWALNKLESGRSIIVVPAAHGGTTILEWLDLVVGANPVWSDMVSRTTLALGQTGNNRVILWAEHQGEQDMAVANNPSDTWHSLMPDAATYQARKIDLIDRVHATFGTFPMTFGLYSPAWNPAGTTTLKPQFETAVRTAANARRYCRAVETYGLADNSSVDALESNIHFSGQSHEVLAQRHFEAMLSILDTMPRLYAIGGIAPVLVYDDTTREYVTVDGLVAERASAPVSSDGLSGTETASQPRSDLLGPVQTSASLNADRLPPVAISASFVHDDITRAEAGATLRADNLDAVEAKANLQRDMIAGMESAASSVRDFFSALDSLATLKRDVFAVADSGSTPQRSGTLSPAEVSAALRNDTVAATDFLLALALDVVAACERLAVVRGDSAGAIAASVENSGLSRTQVDVSAAVTATPHLPLEWLGVVLVSADSVPPVEIGAGLRGSSREPLELAGSARLTGHAFVDLLQNVSGDLVFIVEQGGSVAPRQRGQSESATGVSSIARAAGADISAMLSGRGLPSVEFETIVAAVTKIMAEPGTGISERQSTPAEAAGSLGGAARARAEHLASAIAATRGAFETSALVRADTFALGEGMTGLTATLRSSSDSAHALRVEAVFMGEMCGLVLMSDASPLEWLGLIILTAEPDGNILARPRVQEILAAPRTDAVLARRSN